MKSSLFYQIAVLFLSLCCIFVDVLSLPVALPGRGLDLEVIEVRAAPPAPPKSRSPSPPPKPKVDPARESFKNFMTWLKGPEGKKHSSVCFYTGDTKGRKVYKELHKLEKQIKCESIDTIVRGSGKAPNEVWRGWTFQEWVEASRVLADQARGVASVALGQNYKQTDVFFTEERPRLQRGIKEKRVTRVDKYTMNDKYDFVGPTKLD